MPPPFSCDYCGEYYESARSLRLHLEDAEHSESDDEDEDEEDDDDDDASKRSSVFFGSNVSSSKKQLGKKASKKTSPSDAHATEQKLLAAMLGRRGQISRVLDEQEERERADPALRWRRQKQHSPHSHGTFCRAVRCVSCGVWCVV